MTRITYEMVSCTDVPDQEIVQYNEEFKAHGEECYVLWLLERLGGIRQWKKNAMSDRRTRYFAFVVNGELVGIARITLHLNNKASGHIGYGIRPSKRDHGFAPIMLRMIYDACVKVGLKEPTACVDATNFKSLAAFGRAGWVRTGKIYQWKPNPGPREAVEFVPGMYGKC